MTLLLCICGVALLSRSWRVGVGSALVLYGLSRIGGQAGTWLAVGFVVLVIVGMRVEARRRQRVRYRAPIR